MRRNRVTMLCVDCYRKSLPDKNRLIICDNCGKLKPYKVKNLCSTCSNKLYYKKVPRSIIGVCKQCKQQKTIGVKSGTCKQCIKILYKRHYQTTRCKSDINYNLITKLRTQVYKALTGIYKKEHIHTIDLLGCTIPEFKQHIEQQFKPGMSWDNYGRHGWHNDHIKPVNMFDLTDPKQLKECFHYTNYQPSWESDNCAKGAKYIG